MQAKHLSLSLSKFCLLSEKKNKQKKTTKQKCIVSFNLLSYKFSVAGWVIRDTAATHSSNEFLEPSISQTSRFLELIFVSSDILLSNFPPISGTSQYLEPIIVSLEGSRKRDSTAVSRKSVHTRGLIPGPVPVASSGNQVLLYELHIFFKKKSSRRDYSLVSLRLVQ